MNESYTIPDDVIWTDLSDEIVILKLDTGIYFGLDQVGARIWKLIAEGRSRDDVVREICAEYDAPGEQIERDFEELVTELSQEGLVKTAA
jgi:Coenzyme PQQ synthesis protein D (PqqD)